MKGKALTPVREGLGVNTRWYYKFYFYSFKWDDEVIEWKEMEKIKWKAITTWDMVDSFTLKSIGEGTRLIYEMDYTPPYGILGKIWYGFFVHKNLKNHLEYTLFQMKKNAEEMSKFKNETMYG
jgi:uncharacterized membrane protein